MKSAQTLKGILVGMLIGAFIGFIWASLNSEPVESDIDNVGNLIFELLSIVPGAIIGGTVGGILANDKTKQKNSKKR